MSDKDTISALAAAFAVGKSKGSDADKFKLEGSQIDNRFFRRLIVAESEETIDSFFSMHPECAGIRQTADILKHEGKEQFIRCSQALSNYSMMLSRENNTTELQILNKKADDFRLELMRYSAGDVRRDLAFEHVYSEIRNMFRQFDGD